MTKIIENSVTQTTYVSGEEKNGVTQELLKTLFDYKNGFLYWKIRPANCVQIGDIAASMHKHPISGNRYTTKIKSRNYKHSRIVFLWHHGWLPPIVDHEDRDAMNDKIDNLRSSTRRQNNANKTSAKGSTSKYLGVNLHLNKYWKAEIRLNGKSKHIGLFKTQELAALAYNKFAVRHHGEFANLNIIKA